MPRTLHAISETLASAGLPSNVSEVPAFALATVSVLLPRNNTPTWQAADAAPFPGGLQYKGLSLLMRSHAIRQKMETHQSGFLSRNACFSRSFNECGKVSDGSRPYPPAAKRDFPQ